MEILLERALPGEEALVQMSASKPVREGLEVQTAGGRVHVVDRTDGLWRIRLPQPAVEFFERLGVSRCRRISVATPRIRPRALPELLARDAGAVAAPTASLHFDDALLATLEPAACAAPA